MNISVRTERMSDIFTKYHVEGMPVGLVIHEFSAPEPLDADSHDHPGDFINWVISGWYKQRHWFWSKIFKEWRYVDKMVYPDQLYLVNAETIHQIIEIAPEGCITVTKWDASRRKPCFWRFDESGAKFREWDQTEFKTI